MRAASARVLSAFICASTLHFSQAKMSWLECARHPINCASEAYYGEPPKKKFKFFNVFCRYERDSKHKGMSELVCLVDALNYNSDKKEDFQKYNAKYCGSWEVNEGHLKYDAPPASIQCSASFECYSLNDKELVAAAYYANQELCVATYDKDGKLQLPEDNQFHTHRFSFHVDEPNERRLMTRMLTGTGFTSVQLGKHPGPASEKTKHPDKKYYVGISGGGFRAMTSAMGAFRGLSTHGALPMVDMFSSVSGGTWFSTMLAFNEKFAQGVLNTDVPIADFAMSFLENEYFKVMNRISKKHCTGKKCDDVIDITLQAFLARDSKIPGTVKQTLSGYILLAQHWDFNWQAVIEDAVLGSETAGKNLNNAEITDATRKKVGAKAKFAFNWLQMHQYGEHEGNKKWFLKARDQSKADKVAQYPVYTTAFYSVDGAKGARAQVKSRGQAINEVFENCYKDGVEDVCGEFDFSELTVGQAASASSAAGASASQSVAMANIFSYARTSIQSLGSKGCAILTRFVKDFFMTPGVCDKKVIDEAQTVLGCSIKKEKVAATGKRWATFLRDAAVTTTTRMPDGKTSFKNINAMDAGSVDNNGIGSMLAEYLNSDQKQGAQMLVLIQNGLSDQIQMESYFEPQTPETNYGGALCQPILADRATRGLFAEMLERYEQGFTDIGAKFNKIDGHPICGIASPPTIFFKGAPPPHYRFQDKKVPRHITYAYKKDVQIIANKHFYNLNEKKANKIDMLFLMLNGNVGLMPSPNAGSQKYTGTAYGMEKAVDALHKLFPAFFPQ